MFVIHDRLAEIYSVKHILNDDVQLIEEIVIKIWKVLGFRGLHFDKELCVNVWFTLTMDLSE